MNEKDFENLYREYRLQVEETQSKLDELIKKIDKILEGEPDDR